MQNIELISDRPFETMLAEMKRLREEFPGRVLIASIMEEYNKGAWEEIIGRWAPLLNTHVLPVPPTLPCKGGMPLLGAGGRGGASSGHRGHPPPHWVHRTHPGPVFINTSG